MGSTARKATVSPSREGSPKEGNVAELPGTGVLVSAIFVKVTGSADPSPGRAMFFQIRRVAAREKAGRNGPRALHLPRAGLLMAFSSCGSEAPFCDVGLTRVNFPSSERVRSVGARSTRTAKRPEERPQILDEEPELLDRREVAARLVVRPEADALGDLVDQRLRRTRPRGDAEEVEIPLWHAPDG